MARPGATALAAAGGWLLLASLAAAAQPACDDPSTGCAARAEEEADGFAAIHLMRRAAAPPAAAAAAGPTAVVWRDAIEVEREHMAWLQAAAAVHPAHHPGRANIAPDVAEQLKSLQGREMLTPNAQAPPQQPPYAPFQNIALDGTFPAAPAPPSEELRTIPSVCSRNGLLEATIVVDWGWIELPGLGVRVRTRLFNGSYPGPTLRFRRGDHLRITVINRLGEDIPNEMIFQRREGQGTDAHPDGMYGDSPKYQDVGQLPDHPLMMTGRTNNLHDPNTTNFHTHGLHVSCRQPQDEVLNTVILPGASRTYEYDLSPYHSGGNSWYHGHWHGATTLQAHGGMVGALIIEDSPGEVPDWVANARQELAVVHETGWAYYGPDYLKFYPDDAQQGCFPFGSMFSTHCALGHRTGIVANLSGDRLWKLEYADGFGYQVGQKRPTTDVFTVNGQYRPTLSIRTGEWVRLRIVFASGNFPMNLDLTPNTTGATAGGCQMYLLSKDNVYLENAPRLLRKGVFLGAGNRCQVMLRCSHPGSYPLQNRESAYTFSPIDPQQIVMFINVTGEVVMSPPPDVFQPDRPRYLNSLVDVPLSEVETPIVPAAVNYDNGQPVISPVPVLQSDNKTITEFMHYDFANLSPGKRSIPASGYENQPVRFAINNMTFSHEHPMAIFPVGKVIQVQAFGLDAHSWHMHTHPVQYVNFGFTDHSERWGGYFEVGDWADTLQLPSSDYDVRRGDATITNFTATVRFQTDCYTGPLVVHCHVLYHEDLGMMTWFNSTGQEHTINPRFKNTGIFAHAPEQCLKPGHQCAPPHCSGYWYAPRR